MERVFAALETDLAQAIIGLAIFAVMLAAIGAP